MDGYTLEGCRYPPLFLPSLLLFFFAFLLFFDYPRTKHQRERERESGTSCSSGTRRITMALLEQESIGHPVESHSRMCLRTREGSVFSPSLKQTALTCAIDGIITTCAFFFRAALSFSFFESAGFYLFFSSPSRLYLSSSNKEISIFLTRDQII